MSFRTSVTACVGGLLGVLLASGDGLAGPREAVVHRMETLNGAAIASYAVGNHKRARSQLMEALALGKRTHLESHPVVARTNVNLGIVYLEGLHDRAQAVRCFRTALQVRPAIEVTPALATANVLLDFEETRAELPSPVAAADAPETAKIAKARKEREARRKECEAEVTERFETEKDGLLADLEVAKDSVTKERQARVTLQKQKIDTEKALAEVRESERKEREAKEQVQKEKALKEKQLAQVSESERKEREAKEKVQKEKADKEQKLAEAKDSERKEREARAMAEKRATEAKEMLDKEKQLAAARTQDWNTRQEQERLAQEKLEASKGDLPVVLFCAALDKNAKDANVVIHCLTDPKAKGRANAATLHYRAAGAKYYSTLAMKRAKNGGFSAAVLPRNVSGTLLQYYVQASDPRGGVVAMNGKPSLPNVMTLSPRAAQAANDRPTDRRALASSR
jgi:hypothetical protein